MRAQVGEAVAESLSASQCCSFGLELRPRTGGCSVAASRENAIAFSALDKQHNT